jgi:hypothetical protein
MYEYQGVALVPVIMAVAEFLKRQGINTKIIPVVNLVLGLICGILINLNDIPKGIIVGLEITFVAMGIYSGGKSTVELFK